MSVSRQWMLSPGLRTLSLVCLRALSVAVPYCWEHFDKRGWSLWYAEYRFPEELTQTSMSCNLITRMFHQLDKLRKNAFASVILFGTNDSSSISGVEVFRGHELAFLLRPDWLVDYELYPWRKMDPGGEGDPDSGSRVLFLGGGLPIHG
jgi:elongation factor 1-gamma